MIQEIPRPEDPNDVPKDVVVLVCDGVSRVSEDKKERVSFIPVCPHARALEMVMMEFGVPYLRYIVDSREFVKAQSAASEGGESDEESRKIPDWWSSISKEVLFSRYGTSQKKENEVAACLPSLRIDGQWICAYKRKFVQSSAPPADVADFLVKK